jgi:hypothetical protein
MQTGSVLVVGLFMHFVNRTQGDLSVHEIPGVTGLSSAGAVKRIPLKRVGEVRLKRNKRSSNPKERSMYNNNNNVETGEAKPNFLNLQSRYSTNSQLIPKLEITTSPPTLQIPSLILRHRRSKFIYNAWKPFLQSLPVIQPRQPCTFRIKFCL